MKICSLKKVLALPANITHTDNLLSITDIFSSVIQAWVEKLDDTGKKGKSRGQQPAEPNALLEIALQQPTHVVLDALEMAFNGKVNASSKLLD